MAIVHLGVELDESGSVAVAVDDRGAVVAKAVAEKSSDLAAAARSIVASVRSAAPSATRIGAASPYPDAPAVTAAIDALRAGGLTIDALSPSGTAAAVAEAWTGAGRGLSDIVYFSVAERTSGGIIRGGLPLKGAHSRAASLPWLALNPVEREDYRKVGCLEAEVAAGGIVRRLIWRIKAGDRSRVLEAVNEDLSAITVDHVLQAARNGDGVSISVVRDTAKYLGMAAANLAAVLDPEALILGGIMATSADLLLEPVRTEVGRRLPRAFIESMPILPAALGSDAAAIGAARLSASTQQ